MKNCKKCGISKSISDFNKCRRLPSGLDIYCKICRCELSKDANRKRRAALRAYDKARYAANPAPKKMAVKKWAKNNSKKVKINDQAKRKANPEKYKAIGNANCVKYQLSKKHRTPPWLTKAQLNEIKEFYVLAQELSWLSEDSLEVDHIVPLQGKIVSGLHVPWNLQILPQKDNMIKGNKYGV